MKRFAPVSPGSFYFSARSALATSGESEMALVADQDFQFWRARDGQSPASAREVFARSPFYFARAVMGGERENWKTLDCQYPGLTSFQWM